MLDSAGSVELILVVDYSPATDTREHKALLRAALAEAGATPQEQPGRLLAATYATPAAALAALRAIRAATLAEEVRAALHAGRGPAAGDLLGRAAALAAVANPGQVLFSAAAA